MLRIKQDRYAEPRVDYLNLQKQQVELQNRAYFNHVSFCYCLRSAVPNISHLISNIVGVDANPEPEYRQHVADNLLGLILCGVRSAKQGFSEEASNTIHQGNARGCFHVIINQSIQNLAAHFAPVYTFVSSPSHRFC